MIIQISVAVIAIAFVVLVVFLITTLRSVTSLLGQTNTTIRELQNEVKNMTQEASELLGHTNEVTMDILQKLHALEPVFDSVKLAGEAVEEVTSSVKQASAAAARTIKEKVTEEACRPMAGTIAKALQLAPVVLEAWHQIKRRQSPAP
ncbi:hypothetical protein GCM10023310_55800 [Paenibacillus vulneris]|uniref:DUF948 domain-containing protein n=1 Tax=Paenibacillus vulneris TaxID=1133364 RepID=A0ABW3UTV0_9BACL|nr:DUF948 domain-containing protein [Paenibacillus sp. 32352]